MTVAGIRFNSTSTRFVPVLLPASFQRRASNLAANWRKELCSYLRRLWWITGVQNPLAVGRLNLLSHDNEDPSAEEVALEMGDMLARIHWRAGFDVRDVEFIIDFNQVEFPSLFYRLNYSLDEKMGGVIEGIPILVDAFS